jgi:hypothetical protein
MAFGDDELAAAFDDLAAAGATVPVVWQGVTVQALRDEEDVIRTTPEGVDLDVLDSVIRLPVGTLVALREDDELVIDGEACTVREIALEGDGAMRRIRYVRG